MKMLYALGLSLHAKHLLSEMMVRKKKKSTLKKKKSSFNGFLFFLTFSEEKMDKRIL